MYKVIERDAFQERPTQARVMASEPKKEEPKGVWKMADDDYKTPLFRQDPDNARTVKNH